MDRLIFHLAQYSAADPDPLWAVDSPKGLHLKWT
jgi:hypothetical protein